MPKDTLITFESVESRPEVLAQMSDIKRIGRGRQEGEELMLSTRKHLWWFFLL